MTTLVEFVHLGSGSYGEVWRAKDALGRNVAVKYMLTPTTEAQRTAIDHASPLALLGHHPNVVFVYYCNYLPHPRSGTRMPAIVMEYIEGETLRQRLERPIDLPTTLAIGDALCNAITFIHSKGLMHGDLHEDNVMISPDGQVKVIDLLNDRRFSEITSGHRRRGEVDDVESIKAILDGALKATGQIEVLQQFEFGIRGIRNAVGVREVLSQLTSSKRSNPSEASVLSFLSNWNQVERVLNSLAGSSSEKTLSPLVHYPKSLLSRRKSKKSFTS
ncbi:protein kinase domain-containing protein [Cystobacter fuscus]